VVACADTGNGGSFGVSGPKQADGTTADTAVATFFTNLKIKRIEFPEEALERIECSDLANDIYKSYIPADLVDPPQINLTANFRTDDAVPFKGQILGTATVTFPLRAGEATAATYAGTAYVGAITMPSLANGELQEIKLRIDFDGVTGPTFTKSIATP
jgi:hypothetical protein